MRPQSIVLITIIFLSGCVTQPTDKFSYGNVTVKWLGHAGFELLGTKKIYIDPFRINFTDNADYVLLTHEHFDHCDAASVQNLHGKETQIIGTFDCIKNLTGRTNTLRAGEWVDYKNGVRVEAVEAYNVNKTYHKKGTSIGFVVTIDGVTIYHAGDTDFVQEMHNITADIALLPIGGTYTMDVEEAAAAAKAVKPKIVVPMHYNSERFGISGINADPRRLQELLKDTGIEVKIISATGR